jgi:hypothetical protein
MSKTQPPSDVQLYVRKLGNFAQKSKRDVDKAKKRQRAEIRALEFKADKLQTNALEAQSWSPEVARARTLASKRFMYRRRIFDAWCENQHSDKHNEEATRQRLEQSVVWKIYLYVERKWVKNDRPVGGVEIQIRELEMAIRKPRPPDRTKYSKGQRYGRSHIERSLRKVRDLRWLAVTKPGRGRGNATRYVPRAYPIEIDEADNILTAWERWKRTRKTQPFGRP